MVQINKHIGKNAARTIAEAVNGHIRIPNRILQVQKYYDWIH